jgi:2-polyprenyl-3-methyl-5-hydroxy-6-metoxy-1,4-benzoquinol methylase
MTRHLYRPEFFDYIERGSLRSAATVIPIIRSLARVESVLDIGCGRGAWLSEWRRQGVGDVAGADGSYVDQASLAIPVEQFIATDLSQPIDLRRRFDLVQCLEVAEHLPADSADTLVDSLVRHGSVILFSAAVPGQGGEHHVNEQPYGPS